MSPLLLRRRKTLLVNSLLALALVGAVFFAYTSLGTTTSNAATKLRTGTVGRGTVVSTVSASGTLVSPSDLGLGFVTGGVLRRLDVKVGDKVTTGQVLATVDDTSQLQSLTTAKNALASAEASLAVLKQGQTPQQKAAAAIQLQQSKAQISSAQTSLSFTEQSNAQDAANSAAAVTTAQTTLTTDKATLATDKATLARDTATLAADKASNAKNVTQDTQTVSQDTQKVTQDQQAVTQATSALTQAQQQQKATALKDAQSLAQAQQQVSSAQLSYQSQVAQQAVNDAPPTAAQLAQANASVTSAKLQVASAQAAVDGTVLKAPVSGTVLSISTLVGGTVSGGSGSGSAASSSSSGSSSSGSSSSGSSSSGSSSGSGTGSGGSTGSGSGGSSGSSSGGASTGTAAYVTSSDPTPAADIAGHTATVTSGDSGFIVLTGITGLQVQASFSEDDTASLKVGQGATVTLNALPSSPLNAEVASIAGTGTTSNGTVSYAVCLDLVNPPATLKSGETGSVSVITQEADNTLYVPSTAVSTAGGVSTVTLVNGKTQTRTPVQLGIQGDTTTQITSGLTKGETVALSTTTTGSNGFPTGGFPAGRGTAGTLGGTGGLTGGGFAGGGGAARG